jgi:hypothetical protein
MIATRQAIGSLKEGAMSEGANAAHRDENIFVQRDNRADEGRRHVRLTRENVLISRRFGGIAMMIAVPVPAYRGVALDVQALSGGGASYRLALAHDDPDLDVVLAETLDGGAVAADWRYWANYFDLPRLSAENGEMRALDAPRPPGGTTARRRGAVSVRMRRPRFLARRQGGDAARLAAVFSGEREIICYE